MQRGLQVSKDRFRQDDCGHELVAGARGATSQGFSSVTRWMLFRSR